MSSAATTRLEFYLRNDDTGEVFTLGPMYSGTDEYVHRKLMLEGLTYPWSLLKVVGRRV